MSITVTITITGEEVRHLEEAWPDEIPYRPVQAIEFTYDYAGEYICVHASSHAGDFVLNPPYASREFKRALKSLAEAVWEEDLTAGCAGATEEIPF
jgi:hypothetical protein